MPTNLSWDGCDQRKEWGAASHQRTSQDSPGDNTTLNTLRVTHVRSWLSSIQSPDDLAQWRLQSWVHTMAKLSRKWLVGCQIYNKKKSLFCLFFDILLSQACGVLISSKFMEESNNSYRWEMFLVEKWLPLSAKAVQHLTICQGWVRSSGRILQMTRLELVRFIYRDYWACIKTFNNVLWV